MEVPGGTTIVDETEHVRTARVDARALERRRGASVTGRLMSLLQNTPPVPAKDREELSALRRKAKGVALSGATVTVTAAGASVEHATSSCSTSDGATGNWSASTADAYGGGASLPTSSTCGAKNDSTRRLWPSGRVNTGSTQPASDAPQERGAGVRDGVRVAERVAEYDGRAVGEANIDPDAQLDGETVGDDDRLGEAEDEGLDDTVWNHDRDGDIDGDLDKDADVDGD